uniref:Apple domain-containing protein n=1 Tax=Pyrodinium bahamense TaxID=73915 RepID=A0A7S0B9M5_9DINO
MDLFRAMPAAVASAQPTEDNDLADVGGVLKYIHTELLTEHLGDPLRKQRKYNIDSIRKQRFKLRNPDSLLQSTPFPDFGPFVTYDWGEATNKAQHLIMEQYGDFVGIQQGCTNGNCDVRYPATVPYNWFSVGNWCPNLPFAQKGSKQNPSPRCLKHKNKYLMGGLCFGGADHINAVPVVEPTGAPGCVYSYGRASLVMLDDLAGITHEDCTGGVKCRNWLHFRNNCTNEKYRSQFDPITGQIKNVDYCVEYDVHPQCEANCQAPNCAAIRGKGQIMELGLPFWQGRCDPQANQRRLEVTASSFGIAGALDRHESLDQAILNLSEKCVYEKSSNCKPVGNGTAGPYCTRRLTGVCQPCYIPGTKTGPDATPKPFCPFDILDSVDYRDTNTIPPPACKSKRPRDLCCLYSSSCDVSAGILQHPLDDDGMALAASHGGTPPVEALLEHAHQQGMLEVGALHGPALRRAAYYHWAPYPTGMTLKEVLTRVQQFLRDPPVELFTAKMVATTDSATTTPGTYCFEEGVAFYPLDMEGTTCLPAADAWECQEKCANTTGCTHFSFLQGPGHCHLQDFLATRTPLSIGYTSGPFKCWGDMDESTKEGLIVKERDTYLPAELSCLELDTGYEPALVVLGQRAPSLIGLTVREESAACQKYCEAVDGCAHFTLLGRLGLCNLAGAGASRVPTLGAVSGPPVCPEKQRGDLLAMQKFGALPWPLGGVLAGSGTREIATVVVSALLTAAIAAAARAKACRRPGAAQARVYRPVDPRAGGSTAAAPMLRGPAQDGRALLVVP